MKKQLAVLLAVVMCFSIFAVGCGNDDNGVDPIVQDDGFVWYDFDLESYIQVGQHRGIEIAAANMPTIIEVTEEDITRQVNRMLAFLAETEEVFEGYVMWDDNADINFAGYRDDERFPGGTGQTKLGIGSGTFIPGFEEQLVDVAIGDTVTIDVTFPAFYPQSPDLEGVTVQFVVTINYVVRSTMPEFTDDLVFDITGYETLAELRDSIREELQEDRAGRFEIELEDLLWTRILDTTTVIDYPSEELNRKFNESRREVEEHAENHGFTWNQFLLEIEMTETEVNMILLEQVQREMSFEMALIQISRLEGIEITDSLVAEGVQRMLTEMEFVDEQDFIDNVGMTAIEAFGRQTIILAVLYEKVLGIMKDTMIVVE